MVGRVGWQLYVESGSGLGCWAGWWAREGPSVADLDIPAQRSSGLDPKQQAKGASIWKVLSCAGTTLQSLTRKRC